MTEFIAEKRLGSWHPIDDNGYEVCKGYRNGARALVSIKDMDKPTDRQRRYLFALFSILLESQEVYKSLDDMRTTLLIVLGFCSWHKTRIGNIPVAQSLASGKCSKAKMMEITEKVLDFAVEKGFDREQLAAEAKERAHG